MKLEITEAQLNAIKRMADDIEAMCGGYDDEVEMNFQKNLRLVDRFLKKNNLSR